MSMSDDLRARIVPRILADYDFKKSDDGAWFNQGRCPVCNKRSLFTAAANPWVIRCGREAKCAAEFSVRDLYPDEFGQFNQRHPATEQNPMATADAYMNEARGLDVAHMRKYNYYTQENWWSSKAKSGTATVRFAIPGTDNSYMERFVDPVEIVNADGSRELRKQNFFGPHRGLWWQPPEMAINAGDEVWITEAIIDAISLYQNGIKAVATLSCSNYPSKSLEKCPPDVKWVWALDNDKAGKSAIRKFVKRMRDEGRDVHAAIAPAKSKMDWNDLHRLHRLGESDLAEYRYHGALLIAKSVAEKGALIYCKTKANGFVVDFADRMYWFSIDERLFNDAREQADIELSEKEVELAAAIEAAQPRQIANARPEFLYFQRNEITDEAWFYCRVHFPDGRPAVNLTFTPGQITAAAEFKKRLASAQGAWWSGDAKHLDWIGSRTLQGLKTVETIEYIGYSKEHDCYIFPDIAVHGAKLYAINEQDYFDLPRKSIKSLARERQMTIETTNRNYRADWAQLVWQAFGTDGMIAAVYWFGSLFAEQIRKHQSSFSFLEIIGEPGSGKTTLIEFLWRLLGQDREGIDPNKGTRAGLDRSLAQHSAMPNVFIEADRAEDSHSKRFDWDELKPFYNGRGMRVRGMKNSGNETYEPPFRGSLVIAQNDPVNASDAVLERIVQLRFTKAGHSAASKQATDEMTRLSIEQLSYFTLLATLRANEIVEHVKNRLDKLQNALLAFEDINHQRLAKNHAQLIALAEKFAELVGLTTEQKNATCKALRDACAERQIALSQDHPIVAEFWEIFDYLDAQGTDSDGHPKPLLNHAREPGLIAINLNEFVEHASFARQQVPELKELKRHLKSSKHRKFIESSRTVCSNIAINKHGKPKTPRCWIFQRAKSEMQS